MRVSRCKNDGSDAGGASVTAKFDDIACGLTDIGSGELAHAASWSTTRVNSKRMGITSWYLQYDDRRPRLVVQNSIFFTENTVIETAVTLPLRIDTGLREACRR
jgi:hypothetical protein